MKRVLAMKESQRNESRNESSRVEHQSKKRLQRITITRIGMHCMTNEFDENYLHTTRCKTLTHIHGIDQRRQMIALSTALIIAIRVSKREKEKRASQQRWQMWSES